MAPPEAKPVEVLTKSAPAALLRVHAPTFSSSSYQGSFAHYEFKTDPYGRGGRRGDRVRETTPTYAYEDEDQSTGLALKLGMEVRHPQFGVGTVLSIEALNDDTKLVVRFNTVGRKTLRAKFARLEPA